MALKLHMHPLSSFCWKALVAFYENDTPFEPMVIEFGGDDTAFKKLWPIGNIPVLEDTARDQLVPEASIIIEYLDQHYPGRTRFVPSDPDAARQMRFRDRFYDLYLQVPMQKIVTDNIRPEGKNDPFGVDQARAMLRTAYKLIDEEMKNKTWAMGDDFTMADCAAAPALYYAGRAESFAGMKNVEAYAARLMARPSFARAFAEAQPYMQNFPIKD